MRLAILASLAVACSAGADQVLLQNGDRYNGKVVSLSTNSIVLQSDVIGTVTLPRTKVASVDFGSAAVAPASTITTTKTPSIIMSGKAGARTNAVGVVDPGLRQMMSQTNLIQQVSGQYLQGTTPEVQAKYTQMLNDLSSGKMTIGDLRKQAKDAADQLRSLEKESGDEDTGTIDMYLGVLDSFLNETPAETSTNATRVVK